MNNSFSPHIFLAQNYWSKHLKPQDIAIDMTCGNGHDTLFLCRLLSEGMVFGLDIQKKALQKTRELLINQGIQESFFHLFQQSHAEPISIASPPRLIVYNLGYLPGGDKSIVTKSNSTLESLHRSVELLALDGALSVMCYPGHEEGLEEEKQVLKWAKTLCASKWRVCLHQWINRNRSPSLLWIERILNTCAS